jgi:hypothetical protein
MSLTPEEREIVRETMRRDIEPLLAAGMTSREAFAYLIGIMEATNRATRITGWNLSAHEAFAEGADRVVGVLGPSPHERKPGD